ncbi:cysteine synthase family protein [Shouchella sp. 1P09AA]|uniref:cysteine synthase family protein n=1 Tax=unclassified Shouchella TaxID=2893065 RepID=UPI0039A234B3
MNNISSIYGDYQFPRLSLLKNNLTGASFHLMKLAPAIHIIEKAEKKGYLKKGDTIIETTSGTFGLALAMCAIIKNYKLILVSDPAIDTNLYKRLRELNVDIRIVEKESNNLGFQELRLEILKNILTENPNYYWPNQYDNYWNTEAYFKISDYISENTEKIDCIIGPVGSGGSMSGIVGRYREKYNPSVKSFGVDTNNSVLFGQQNGKRVLRGLGNSLMPKNLNHSLFDYVSWIDAKSSFEYTRELHNKYGLFLGPTSGAAYGVANWYSEKNPKEKILVIFPDEGNRYIESVYNDSWITENFGLNNFNTNELNSPVRIKSLKEAAHYYWSYIEWNRRILDDVKVDSKHEQS